jgi:hypothetical protein
MAIIGERDRELAEKLVIALAANAGFSTASDNLVARALQIVAAFRLATEPKEPK